MGWSNEDYLYYTVTHKNIDNERKYEVKTYILGALKVKHKKLEIKKNR